MRREPTHRIRSTFRTRGIALWDRGAQHSAHLRGPVFLLLAVFGAVDCRRNVEMSPGAQSRNDTAVGDGHDERDLPTTSAPAGPRPAATAYNERTRCAGFGHALATKVVADRHPLRLPYRIKSLFSVASCAPAFLSCSTRRVAASDVVRVHRMLPDRRDFDPCCPVFWRYFGEARCRCHDRGLVDGRESQDRSVGVTQGEVRAR
jgi:hypothetical protein